MPAAVLTRFGGSERRAVLVAALTLLPFTAIRFLGLGGGIPVVVATGIGVAIVAAAFFLTWATEALEVVIAAPVALAILALVEVAPEYAFEILLAYRQQVTLAAASMTGANRLLLGLGWPLIFFVAFVSARRKGERFSEIRLDARHSVTIAYLFVASLYAFVIVIKRSLSIIDSAVLIAIYGMYIYNGLRTRKLEADVAELEEDDAGVGAATRDLPAGRRAAAIALFLAAGAFVLLFGAEPFMDSLLASARRAGVSEFALIQWVAPFLSEFPESLTAFLWAATITRAALGLGNLMSSKLNQWTLLIAAVPLAYSVGVGHVAPLHLTAQSVDEIFLTAAQSLFGTVVLLTLRFRMRDAILLFGLFVVQFAVPIERVHVAIGVVYLALAVGYGLYLRREIRDADVLGNLWTVHLVRRLRASASPSDLNRPGVDTTAPKNMSTGLTDSGLLGVALDVQRATRQGREALERRQQDRLADLVAYARAHSPFYRQLYKDLRDDVRDPTQLPVTNKSALMAHFDEWVTDRAVTRGLVDDFVADPSRIGSSFLGRYTVATTSGTTSERGIFVMDDHSMTVTKALALRMLRDWLSMRDVGRLLKRGARLTMINATGGHFASAIAGARLLRGGSRRARRVQVLSVATPLDGLVASLNQFRPAVVAVYASVGAMLASEQEAGRLSITPALVVLSAEGLAIPEYARIARAFGAKVRTSYAATECPFLSHSCSEEWMHVNSDWVLLEPVDADYWPTPAGRVSQTVLVSNLANRVQPILRYDLGDRVLLRRDPCPCGNPLPAIRVRGRSADVLTFRNAHGEPIVIAPLAVTSLVGEIAGVERFQVEQVAPMALCVRLRTMPGYERELLWAAARVHLKTLLKAHGLADVVIHRDERAPQQGTGGKVREIIPLPTEHP